MASKTTVQHVFTDDLSHLAGVSLEAPAPAEGEEAPAKGASLPSGQRVRITVTDGDYVFVTDTRRDHPIAQTLRSEGEKQKKRGAKKQ